MAGGNIELYDTRDLSSMPGMVSKGLYVHRRPFGRRPLNSR